MILFYLLYKYYKGKKNNSCNFLDNPKILYFLKKHNPINKQIQINVKIKMSKYKKYNKFYFIKNIINSYYFIIVVSLLSFIVFISENTSLLQTIEAQSSNTQVQNNNVNTQGSNPVQNNNFLISGPLSSFLSTPTGNWVVNGSWALEVQNGNVSFFSGNMQWDPTNLTKLSHTHNFANFRALPDTQSISLGPNRVIDIKGVMDIGANNKIEWVNVPAEIKTAGNTITVLILDDAKTGNHFNNYPIFGKISHLEKCSDNGGFGANMDYDPSIVKCSS